MATDTRAFHSERKVPGGKLLVLDGTQTDGRVSELTLSGDFFIEPEEAYFAIAPALIGVKATDHRADIAARIDGALAAAAHEAGMDRPALHGFTTDDVAYALKRGMVGATDFYDHDWELIHDIVRPTRHNVALDQVLLEEVASGRRKPTLRFWEWEDTATVIGAFQSYANEVDQAGVDKYGVQVVRRISGGGAMFMEGGNCVTFSMYVPGSLVAGLDYEESYSYLDKWVLQALQDLGVNAFYVPINDISSDQGKIGGAAQRRLPDGTVLHHDTMSYDIDADKMGEVLRTGKAKISDKGIRSAKRRVDPLRSQTGVARQDIIAQMQKAFTGLTGARVGAVKESELARALELVDVKFGTDDWTHRVP